ncbi:hypothetical protein H6G36_02315 [Anabaena minutissima FACHB-250]|nr:hypothetical protein [Anabaena minutissima FACHB-250]
MPPLPPVEHSPQRVQLTRHWGEGAAVVLLRLRSHFSATKLKRDSR